MGRRRGFVFRALCLATRNFPSLSSKVRGSSSATRGSPGRGSIPACTGDGRERPVEGMIAPRSARDVASRRRGSRRTPKPTRRGRTLRPGARRARPGSAFRTARVDDSLRIQGQRRAVRRRGAPPPARPPGANGEVFPLLAHREVPLPTPVRLFARLLCPPKGVATMAHFPATFSRVSSLIAAVLVLGGLALGPRTGVAHPFVVDQHNDLVLTSQGYVIPGFGAVGQGFTPALPRLDAVEMYLNTQISGSGGMAFVRIRDGGIAGAILGTSGVQAVPAVTLPLTLIHFDFPVTVLLTPGALHVIEVVAVSGSMGVFGSGFGNNSYPGGTAYFMGSPVPDTDLWFREGPVDVTPVATTTWCRLKKLYR